jgi:hypothetical protein
MKKQILAVVICLFSTISIFAQSGTIGTLTWNLENGTLTISGNRDMPDFEQGTSVPWYRYRYSITTIIIENGVTSIGQYAFYQTDQMTSIVIPNSVISIGNYAFAYCSKLTSIVIPNSVISIGGGAFYGCSELASIDMSNSITSLGGNIFDGTPWYNNQPDGEIYFGKIFYSYKGIMEEDTHVSIKEGTLSICAGAFDEQRKSFSIDIPNSVTSIGERTFYGCEGLTSIIIPEGVTSIGILAFSDCSNLTSIVLPNSLTSIEYGAFQRSGLTSVTIPNSVTSIEESTFAECERLASVTIGNKVTSIATDAFFCPGLTEIHSKNPTPPTIRKYAFYEVNKTYCKLYVPKGSYDAYKNASYWREFYNIIEEDATGIEDVSMQNISLYPNPAKDDLFISSDSPIEKIEIYNLSGLRILAEANFAKKIDVSHLANGIYFVRIYSESAVVTQKIIVKK